MEIKFKENIDPSITNYDYTGVKALHNGKEYVHITGTKEVHDHLKYGLKAFFEILLTAGIGLASSKVRRHLEKAFYDKVKVSYFVPNDKVQIDPLKFEAKRNVLKNEISIVGVYPVPDFENEGSHVRAVFPANRHDPELLTIGVTEWDGHERYIPPELFNSIMSKVASAKKARSLFPKELLGLAPHAEFDRDSIINSYDPTIVLKGLHIDETLEKDIDFSKFANNKEFFRDSIRITGRLSYLKYASKELLEDTSSDSLRNMIKASLLSAPQLYIERTLEQVPKAMSEIPAEHVEKRRHGRGISKKYETNKLFPKRLRIRRKVETAGQEVRQRWLGTKKNLSHENQFKLRLQKNVENYNKLQAAQSEVQQPIQEKKPLKQTETKNKFEVFDLKSKTLQNDINKLEGSIKPFDIAFILFDDVFYAREFTTQEARENIPQVIQDDINQIINELKNRFVI